MEISLDYRTGFHKFIRNFSLYSMPDWTFGVVTASRLEVMDSADSSPSPTFGERPGRAGGTRGSEDPGTRTCVQAPRHPHLVPTSFIQLLVLLKFKQPDRLDNSARVGVPPVRY